MANDNPHVATLLTYAETAKILRVTIRTVRTWYKSGELRAIRLGPGSVRFDPADISKFIEDRRTGGAR